METIRTHCAAARRKTKKTNKQKHYNSFQIANIFVNKLQSFVSTIQMNSHTKAKKITRKKQMIKSARFGIGDVFCVILIISTSLLWGLRWQMGTKNILVLFILFFKWITFASCWWCVYTMAAAFHVSLHNSLI